MNILNILPEHHFVFRNGFSTKLQVVRVVDRMKDPSQKKDTTETILLDVGKPFERI